MTISARGQVGGVQQGARRRLGVGTTRADGGDAVFGFQDVAVAGQDQGVFAVGHDQHGFQAAQHTIGTPVAGEFHRGAHQVALVFFQLGLETFLQGEGVGRGAGKACQDLIMVEPADLAGRALDDDIAQGDLAVAAQGDVVAAPDTNNGGGVKLFHAVLSWWRESDGGVSPKFKNVC